MQIKLLNDILSNVVGRQALDIVNLLAGKKNVNEFILAKKLKLTINQVRNILYKLSHAGLVSFTRKKDKRKGWYTYFWTLNIEKSLELLESNIRKELDSLRNQLKNRESRRFYFCITCKTEVNEETALLHNFTCNECGEVYELQTDKKIINDLVLKIKKLELGISVIEKEISIVREKEVKKKAKLEKKEIKEKKAKRKAVNHAKKKIKTEKKSVKKKKK
ncbi:MAG: hypothetical protein KKB21_00650 [Nanoarchaeota archaeon]|nr:hypothetical protein [Nanoarchaeota archaeon]MBU4086064.1 hypothetical protein [Nanoarchaeota archaeon]